MKQLVQSVKSGDLRLTEVPVPVVGPTQVLVETHRSTVSPGTERTVRELASASLLGKARARPDLVRQVVARAQTEGILNTAKAVRNKLDDLMPLGYSGVGTVVEVGAHVPDIRPGMRVATGGAGHGEYQLVSGMLAVPVPDNVSDENAAVTTVASIALHGVRLANLQPGCRVAVVGLGLIGQITLRLLRASGCHAYGIDLREFAVERAKEAGFLAEVEQGAETTRRVMDWTKGMGVDAVLITAGTTSSEPTRRSLEISRDRGEIVVVGAVGMEMDRNALFEKEVSVRVARSYGPGRYERSYEDWAVDYPAGYVRWTEGRNLEAVLEMMASGMLDLEDLVTHRYKFADATMAYDELSDGAEFFGIQLEYERGRSSIDRSPVTVEPKKRRVPSRSGPARLGIVGAGNFVRATMLPAVQSSGIGRITAVCSATGVSARHIAESNNIGTVHTDARTMFEDDEVDAVIIASPHSTHAELVVDALNAGKDVFCEKPLCITKAELASIEAAAKDAEGILQVGFNRRHSPPVQHAIEVLRGTGPMVITYRVNSGELPSSHWYYDRTQGGRLIGEVCHFIDTVLAIGGDANVKSFHVTGSAIDSPELEQDIAIAMSLDNGVVATISYGSHGHSSMPKEQIEIVGRGHSIKIDNFDTITVDGKDDQSISGKGHSDQLTHFARRARQGDNAQIFGLSASRLAIEAVEQLGVETGGGDETGESRDA